MSSIPSTPGIYRLVSTQLATGVTNANVNDNITFNTNIPSLDFALRIWRVRWWNSFSAWAEDGGAVVDAQLFAQITENQTKTAVLITDTSFLDEIFTDVVSAFATAAGFTLYVGPGEIIHDFRPENTPWTVATKLNIVASKVGGSFHAAGTTWKPVAQLEYTLERLTPDLRDYLAKRLQIQGS